MPSNRCMMRPVQRRPATSCPRLVSCDLCSTGHAADVHTMTGGGWDWQRARAPHRHGGGPEHRACGLRRRRVLLYCRPQSATPGLNLFRFTSRPIATIGRRCHHRAGSRLSGRVGAPLPGGGRATATAAYHLHACGGAEGAEWRLELLGASCSGADGCNGAGGQRRPCAAPGARGSGLSPCGPEPAVGSATPLLPDGSRTPAPNSFIFACTRSAAPAGAAKRPRCGVARRPPLSPTRRLAG
jgi:hypothetical protein